MLFIYNQLKWRFVLVLQHLYHVRIYSTHLVSFGPRWSFQSNMSFLSFRPWSPDTTTWPFWSTLTNFSKRSWATLREKRGKRHYLSQEGRYQMAFREHDVLTRKSFAIWWSNQLNPPLKIVPTKAPFPPICVKVTVPNCFRKLVSPCLKSNYNICDLCQQKPRVNTVGRWTSCLFMAYSLLFYDICRSGANVQHASQNNLLRATGQSFWTLNWFKPEICKWPAYDTHKHLVRLFVIFVWVNSLISPASLHTIIYLMRECFEPGKHFQTNS